MRSTRPATVVAPYLGVDLTDRHAKSLRAIDVCGLTPRENGFDVELWQWHWDAAPESLLVLGPIADEVGNLARRTVIDGPLGLASVGQTMRFCERLVGAPAKTPDTLPPLTSKSPFAGFVRSSVELARSLYAAGVSIDPTDGGPGVYECYPGHAWPQLAGEALKKKTTAAGRAQRADLLKARGVRLPASPLTDDHLDACLAALIAAALDYKGGGEACPVGETLRHDGDVLREGRMWWLVKQTARDRGDATILVKLPPRDA